MKKITVFINPNENSQIKTKGWPIKDSPSSILVHHKGLGISLEFEGKGTKVTVYKIATKKDIQKGKACYKTDTFDDPIFEQSFKREKE